jgi:hypothetical protein
MIPRSRTLKVEDFPEQSDWIEPIIRALNDGASQTSSALSKALTFGENFNATVQKVEVTLKSDQSAWASPSYLNSWTAFGGVQAPQYRRVGDRVDIRGAVAGGTITTTAFTLPVGCRPPATVYFPTASNNLFGQFYIDSSGNVTPSVGSNVSVWLNCSFLVDGAVAVNAAFPVKFAHKLSNGAKPNGCMVLQVADLTTGARSPASGSGYCAWRPNGSEVIVDDVPGLVAGHKYAVTFLVTGG